MNEETLVQWWTKLLAHAGTRTDLHSKNAPTSGPCARAASGVTGVGFCYSVKQHEAYVELRIDRKAAQENKDMFDRLVRNKHEIELSAGRRLDWERLDERQHSRIGAIVPGGYADAEGRWNVIHENLVDAMMRLKTAIDPYLGELKVE
jgi:hypothetical protein